MNNEVRNRNSYHHHAHHTAVFLIVLTALCLSGCGHKDDSASTTPAANGTSGGGTASAVMPSNAPANLQQQIQGAQADAVRRNNEAQARAAAMKAAQEKAGK